MPYEAHSRSSWRTCGCGREFRSMTAEKCETCLRKNQRERERMRKEIERIVSRVQL